MVNQVLGEYEAREHKMVEYLKEVQRYLHTFQDFSIHGIVREKNQIPNALSKLASTEESELDNSVYMEILQNLSIHRNEVFELEAGPNWMMPIILFIEQVILPDDPKDARRVKFKSLKFCMSNGTLYRRAFLAPYSNV